MNAKRAAYAREYRQKNREKVLALERSSYERNRGRKNAARRNRLANDPEYAERVRALASIGRHRDPARAASACDRTKKWREANPRRARDGRLRANYGMTIDQREAMAEAQGHRCAICNAPEAPGAVLHVDHDHGTGRVRGLLCPQCNTGIGLLRDSIDTLNRAAEYLARAQKADQGYTAP